MGFFIMAIAIMRRHRKNQPKNSQYSNIKYWLKSSLSLTVVMGIAWLGNVLFFTKELLFIAYIMTVFIAAQGIIIFILYVPLSSHVRAAYLKSWNDKRANTGYFSAMLFKRASIASTCTCSIKNISQSATSKSSETQTSSVFVGTRLSVGPPNDPNKILEQELDNMVIPPLPSDYITSEIDRSFVFVNKASIEKEISDE
ncbi:PREDICTED: adhesion G protein-coupled receptor L2-like [Amphimedon queenslandica]|uniref:Uncharacterized protein n=2 Tax=Amphimedon queenslandica TaxID=400682 RepID=A0AAN0JR29_AMPQE|nr:PREDICTED: adhesion G protein-coupled receptor L2-like [Amphimedon queenslandica]|eukprot:XP_019859294.1 PREDICTED: adhesion G protein-coupled receptor L2-like [Amphimedon queenslandica]